MTRTAYRIPIRNHPRKWSHAASSSTKDNRLHTVVDDRHHSYYAYDHAGGSCGSRAQSQACLSYAEMQQRRQSQRTLKVTGRCDRLDINAWILHTVTSLRDHTVYPSPYIVLSNHGYTKHYYAGSERLAARIGGGFGRAILHEQTDLAMTATHLFKQSQHHTNDRHLNAPPAHTIRREGHLERVFRGMEIEFAIPEAVRAEVHLEPEGLIQTAQNIVSDNAEPDVYFYHSDHLGSASWITDGDGKPVQHLQYLPYGEPFVNQRVSGYNERFTFTGKERDAETGYGYFGARYMDHDLMTMWLSVDPLSDKYPSISPYNYCMWNPIKLMGPDGNEPVKPLIKYYGNAFLAVDVLVYAANMYQMIGIIKDNNELRRQTNLLNRAADMVTRAIESGNMFSEIEASNNDFLGDVINYIYQGTHILNGGTIAGRTISPDAINKAKEIMAQNNLDYPLISY